MIWFVFSALSSAVVNAPRLLLVSELTCEVVNVPTCVVVNAATCVVVKAFRLVVFKLFICAVDSRTNSDVEIDWI